MELAFSSTTALAAAIRARKLSAREALDAQLGRIDRHNPALNAVVIRDFERARERARQADEALARGQSWGPLHGVPFTLKDAHATAGVRTTTGFPPLAEHVPAEDGTVATRLKAAGGIRVGKTNAATLLADYQTSNPIFGRSNNPWNVARTPGGSSGGAAAAVAAGLTPFEVGTDMSGSIRIPAHFCGLFGFKPTETRVSLAGVIPGLPGPRPVRIVSCVGPLARTIDDVVLVDSLIAGPDRRDSEVRPVPIAAPPDLALARLRIAVIPTLPGLPVAAAVRQAIEALADQLGQAGARVEPAPLPKLDFDDELASAGALIGMMMGAAQPPEPKQPPTTLASYFQALDRRDRSIRAWETFFDDWDALLCPPAMMTAFPHCDPGAELSVDGKPVSYWTISAHTTVFNYTGHPAVVLPYRRDTDGLPLGLQLVGARWNDAALLAAARAVTALTGAFQPPPGYAAS
jgi:amidase